MGGTCHSRLDADVTHVVFRDGRGATYEKALKKDLHLVNVLWLEYCKWHKVKVLEKDYRAKPPPVIEKPDPFGLGLNKGAKRYARKPRSMNNLLDSESRSAERVKRRKKRLERKEKLKELMSPPKKQLFDENGEELPTLSQILASETPQPLLQGFVSETPWPPKRPLGGRDEGASPRLKSYDDEDAEDETSAVIRSAEKRNQKVKDLLRRMQSSDEEDFLCEPLTQAMAPLHVRLNLHKSTEKERSRSMGGGSLSSSDGVVNQESNLPSKPSTLSKGAPTPYKGVTFRPELSIVPNSPSFASDCSTTATAVAAAASVAATASPQLDTSRVKAATKVPSTLKAWLDNDDEEEIPLSDDECDDERDHDDDRDDDRDDDCEKEEEEDRASRASNAGSKKYQSSDDNPKEDQGKSTAEIQKSSKKNQRDIVDDEEDILATEREREICQQRPNVVIPETQNFLGGDWVGGGGLKELCNGGGVKEDNEREEQLEETRMFDDDATGPTAQTKFANPLPPPPPPPAASVPSSESVPQSSISSSSSASRIRRRSRASCRFDAPILASPSTPKPRKTFLDFVNDKRKTPQKTRTTTEEDLRTPPELTMTTPAPAALTTKKRGKADEAVLSIGVNADAENASAVVAEPTLSPPSLPAESTLSPPPLPAATASAPSSAPILDNSSLRKKTSPPVSAKFFSQCSRKSTSSKGKSSNSKSCSKSNHESESDPSKRRSTRPLATAKKSSLSPSSNKVITEYFSSQTSSAGKSQQNTESSHNSPEVKEPETKEQEEEEESVIDTTVKSPSIVERLLTKSHHEKSKITSSSASSTSLDSTSSSSSSSARKRLSSEIEDDNEDDGKSDKTDGKRRKTLTPTLPTIPGTPTEKRAQTKTNPTLQSEPKTPVMNIPRRKKLYALKEFSTPPESLLSPTAGRDLSPSVVVGLNNNKKRSKPLFVGNKGKNDRRRSTRIARTESQSSIENDDDDVLGLANGSNAVGADDVPPIAVEQPEMTVRPSIRSAGNKDDGGLNGAILNGNNPVKKSSSDVTLLNRRKSAAVKKSTLSESDALLSADHRKSLANDISTPPALEDMIDAVSDVSAGAVSRRRIGASVVEAAVEKENTPAAETIKDAAVYSPRLVKRKSAAVARGKLQQPEKTTGTASDGSAGSLTNSDGKRTSQKKETSQEDVAKSRSSTAKSLTSSSVTPTSSSAAASSSSSSLAKSVSSSTDVASIASQPDKDDEKSKETLMALMAAGNARNSLDDFRLKPQKKKKNADKKPKATTAAASRKSSKSKPASKSSSSSSTSSSSDEKTSRGRLTINASSKRSSRLPGLMMTSCHRHQQDSVKSALEILSEKFVLCPSFTTSVTHVVSGEPRRTLNLLRGIVAGCWVVSIEWIVESLAAGRWLEEEGFECAKDFPTCQITRLNPELTKALFESESSQQKSQSGGDDGDHVPSTASFSRILVDKECFPPRSEVSALILGCGGTLTNCLRNADLVITSKSSVKASRKDVVVVNPTWVLDSITNFQRMPFLEYLVPQDDDGSSEDGMSQEY